MQKDNVIGMIVGCAVGDALGAPYEFMERCDINFTKDSPMIAGGAHDVSVGEWTDDTALMVAAAEAYVERGGFDAGAIAANFKAWRETGNPGTRDYVFDIGGTTDEAIEYMTVERPYAGSASAFASGNGSLMRIAPAIAANHKNVYAAVGESVALALLTHGNHDTVHHISAFVSELMSGRLMPEHRHLRSWDISRTQGTGSIMHSYNVACRADYHSISFEDAMEFAIRCGYDTDTNAAITGMLVGAKLGYSSIPKRWLDTLQQHDYLVDLATRLYEIGDSACLRKTSSKCDD